MAEERQQMLSYYFFVFVLSPHRYFVGKQKKNLSGIKKKQIMFQKGQEGRGAEFLPKLTRTPAPASVFSALAESSNIRRIDERVLFRPLKNFRMSPHIRKLQKLL